MARSLFGSVPTLLIAFLPFLSDGCAITTKTARAARTNTTAVSERFADSSVEIGNGFTPLGGGLPYIMSSKFGTFFTAAVKVVATIKVGAAGIQ